MAGNGKIRWKLSIQMMLAMIIITVIPLSVLSMTLQYKTKQFYAHNTENLYRQIAMQYTENLRYKYNNYWSLTHSVVTLGGVRELLESGAQDFSDVYSRASALSTALASTTAYYNNGNELYNLMIYSMQQAPPLYTSKIVTYQDSLHFDILSEENVRRRYVLREGRGKRRVLSLLFPVAGGGQHTGKAIAYIVVDVDADKFFSIPLRSYTQYDAQALVTLKGADGTLWSGGDAQGRTDKETFSYTQPDVVGSFGWDLDIQFYSAEDSGYLTGYATTIFGVTGVLLLLCMLFAAVFSRRFGARIQVLIKKMKRVQQGDMSPAPPIGGGDELDAIDGYFNRMVEKLNVYINENFLQKIAYKEAQFNILQNQINPHFLYNTLEMIDSMASTQGCFEIGDICSKLGQIFRYNVSKSGREYVRFTEELAHVKSYADIQQLRFSGRFRIEYQIGDGCGKVLMLKFILQPLVENAIVHALEAKGQDGLLRICAELEGDDLKISVCDNGAGFDARKLLDINRFIDAKLDANYVDFSGGIGLKNVITRIKLVYGEKAAIQIVSSEAQGTAVVLRLARIEEQEEGGGSPQVKV